MDVSELYLLQMGFLDHTPRGRVAPAQAYQHLGYEVPSGGTSLQPSLF
ncbi:MAG: hypothetical protein ACUVWR_18165 [Anaerolineae bacterium]